MSIIAIDASSAAKEKRTGVEEYAFQLIQNFKKNALGEDDRVILLVQAPLVGLLGNLPPRWEVRVLNFKLPILKFKNWSFEFGVKKFVRGWMQLLVTWELWRRPPDVFFVPAQALPFFIPKKIKVATTIHDVCFCRFANCYRSAEIKRQRTATKRAAKRAEIIFVPSEVTKQDFLRFYKVKSEKIFITHLAADSDLFQIQESSAVEPILNKYRLSYKNYFLCLGRVEEKKNSAILILAFEQAKTKLGFGDPLRLVFAGPPGYGFSFVKNLWEKSSVKDLVSFLDFVPREDLPQLMAGALALVAPSNCEGFNIPLLEAAACGTPIIASDIPVHTEVMDSAIRLVEVNDAVAWASALFDLARNARLASEFSAKGLVRAKSFSWELTAQKTWQHLKLWKQ